MNDVTKEQAADFIEVLNLLANCIPVGTYDEDSFDLRAQIIDQLHQLATLLDLGRIVHWHDKDADQSRKQIAVEVESLIPIIAGADEIIRGRETLIDNAAFIKALGGDRHE